MDAARWAAATHRCARSAAFDATDGAMSGGSHSAFAAEARTCAADTGRLRPGLGIVDRPDLVDTRTVDDTAIPTDV